MNEKAIRKAAEEMNEVLGLDPPLDPEEEDLDTLIDMIREAAQLIDWENDHFSPKSASIIKSIVGMEESGEEPPSSPAQAEKSTRSEKPAKAKKPGPTATVTRREITARVAEREGFALSLEELAQKADQEYARLTGKSNLKEAMAAARSCWNVFKGLEILKEKFPDIFGK
jgi:cell division septum initiation protein DivIVA